MKFFITMKSPLGNVRVYRDSRSGIVTFDTIAVREMSKTYAAIPLKIPIMIAGKKVGAMKVGLIYRVQRLAPNASGFAPMAVPFFWVFNKHPQKAAVSKADQLKFQRWAQAYVNRGMARRMDMENLKIKAKEYDDEVAVQARIRENGKQLLRKMRRQIISETRRLRK